MDYKKYTELLTKIINKREVRLISETRMIQLILTLNELHYNPPKQPIGKAKAD